MTSIGLLWGCYVRTAVDDFSGLGALDRRDLCNLIANFETTTLLSMSMDRVLNLTCI